MNSARDFQSGGRWWLLPFCFVASIHPSAWGQADTVLQFEAASIKLHTVTSPSTGRSGIEETQGLIRIEDLSLKAIIQAAYGVKDYQFSGPSWLDSVHFDIVAKPPAGYQHPQLQPLLRNLLADRFKLAVHHESKETAGFGLEVAKADPKLREATKPRGYFTVRPGLIEEDRGSLADLANALARIVGRPVVDETGLTAAYEIKLEWRPDPTSAAPVADDSPEAGPSLFAALRDQLGLRLQPKKVAVETLIVDHAEKAPTEN
jgi:uncharacterized protein (TIGR03435 family)